MKISTKGRYGLRTLIDIYFHQKAGPVPLHDIAERQNISAKYLWQVLNPMRSIGLLTVTRGARGGYSLAVPPDCITLLDIVSTIEGPVSIVDCATLPAKERCSRADCCTARAVWTDVNNILIEGLRSITLASILERCKDSSDAGHYTI